MSYNGILAEEALTSMGIQSTESSSIPDGPTRFGLVMQRLYLYSDQRTYNLLDFVPSESFVVGVPSTDESLVVVADMDQ